MLLSRDMKGAMKGAMEEAGTKPCRKPCRRHCLMLVMSLVDGYFEACREFHIEPSRVLSIVLISMCYEACMEHTTK